MCAHDAAKDAPSDRARAGAVADGECCSARSLAGRARMHSTLLRSARDKMRERWTDQLLKKKKQRKMEVEAAGAEEQRE